MKNVLIPVTVQGTPFVHQKITEGFALVSLDILEIHTVLHALKVSNAYGPGEQLCYCLVVCILVPKVVEPFCTIDSQCDSQLACINEDCVNPCTAIDPCAEFAICKVHDTLPLRTMSCTCQPGFTGNGYVQCSKIGMRHFILIIVEKH